MKVKQERESAELEKKRLEERLAKFEEDAKKAQEGLCGVCLSILSAPSLS